MKTRTVQRFPRAVGKAADDQGWTIDPEFLQRIRKEMRNSPDMWIASDEAIESVLLALEKIEGWHT